MSTAVLAPTHLTAGVKPRGECVTIQDLDTSQSNQTTVEPNM